MRRQQSFLNLFHRGGGEYWGREQYVPSLSLSTHTRTYKNRQQTVRLKPCCPLSYEEVGMASTYLPHLSLRQRITAILSLLGKEDRA